MLDPRTLPRSVVDRWERLDTKGAGAGILGLMYLQEASKVAIVRLPFTPGPLYDLAGYTAVGSLLLVGYLFREVDREEAADMAEDVADEATEKVEEATGGDE